MSDIPEKVKMIRDVKGFSQEDLARHLGVSFPTVNSWERGRVTPYPRHRKALEKLYREIVEEIGSRHVIIVEDDESSGLVLADYAEMALPDWKCSVINNGYDAILQISSRKPGIVLPWYMRQPSLTEKSCPIFRPCRSPGSTPMASLPAGYSSR